MTERVRFRCPACRAEWVGAEIVHGAWWAHGLTAEKLARHVYCRQCQQPPPMQAVTAQQELFA